MELKLKDDVQRIMHEQVSKYLLENVHIDLPAKLSDRQADRVVSRRSVDLMMRGMSAAEVILTISSPAKRCLISPQPFGVPILTMKGF